MPYINEIFNLLSITLFIPYFNFSIYHHSPKTFLQNFGKTDISFSPNLIFGNSIEFKMNDKTLLFFNTKYVGKQYMSNTNVESSVLASYLVNDLGLNYNFSIPGFSQDSEFKFLVNNLLNQKPA